MFIEQMKNLQKTFDEKRKKTTTANKQKKKGFSRLQSTKGLLT